MRYPNRRERSAPLVSLMMKRLKNYATNNNTMLALLLCGMVHSLSDHSRTNPTPKTELRTKDLLLPRPTRILNQV